MGTVLECETGDGTASGIIVETEAYLGEHDLACHAAKGRTGRTEVMYMPGGHAYVYFIYGMYDMLNVVTGEKDDPQAVLIRAAEPLGEWGEKVGKRFLAGPGKLCRGMKITRALNGVDLTGDALHFLPRAIGDELRILETVRIGVDYAGAWKDEKLRFIDAGSAAVSKVVKKVGLL